MIENRKLLRDTLIDKAGVQIYSTELIVTAAGMRRTESLFSNAHITPFRYLLVEWLLLKLAIVLIS
jgi:hypothetical protein